MEEQRLQYDQQLVAMEVAPGKVVTQEAVQENEEGDPEGDTEHEVTTDGAQTLYVQVEAGEELVEHPGDPNTHIIHIIREGDYDEELDEEVDLDDGEPTTYLEEEDDLEEEDLHEVQLVNGKMVHYIPIGRTRQPATPMTSFESTTSTAAKKHSCGEDNCHCAYRSKKSLVQHLNLAHGLRLVTFDRSYGSVAHILYEFERIQRYANYLFGADYKTFNSSTKQLRVIYVCAHDRKLRKNRQTGQVCTAFIEFAADYNTGQGSLSGCLQHYKHGGYRDLSDYQFVSAEDVPPDFELACPICCEIFATEEEMLQHAFDKIHHIAPRFIRMAKKKEARDAGWETEVTNTLIRCDMCTFETSDRSYFMTHRVKSHMGPECIEKHVAKNREDANYIFRQAQIALNTRFFLANKRVNDSSIVSYSFRCNFNRRSLTSVCVCSFKMLEFPDGNRFEIEMVKAHSHDVSAPCEEELDDLPPPPELFTCQTCDRVFQNEAILRDHQKANNHYNVVELEAKKNRELEKPKQFFCCVCSVGFTKKLSLRQHQKNFNHNYTPASVRAPISSHGQVVHDSSDMNKEHSGEASSTVREKKVIQLFPHLCYDCGQTLSNKVELLKHLNAEHGYEVDLFTKEFANMDLVWRYFYEIQLNTKTRYKQHGSQKVDEDNFKIYYICNREGKDKTKKVNRKRGRRKPPKDVNRACTAHFTIRRDNGKIICSGSTTHYGHDIEEEFLLRGKILQKAMEIIQKVPDEAAEDMHVLTAADFPYHSEKREMQKTYKNPDAIPWSQPFSDTFTVTPINGDTAFYVGPTDKPPRMVSHKMPGDTFCTICAGKPSRSSTGQIYQCPHIYQCDCDFYQAGYHNCKHINVLELYLNQESTQGNVLYLTAPCSEKDLAIRGQAAKLAQLSEDVIRILENLNASEDSTKLLTVKMDAVKSLLASSNVSDAETQTEEMYQLETEVTPVLMRPIVQTGDERVVTQVVATEERQPRVPAGQPLVVHPIERTRAGAARKAIIVNASQSPRLVVRKGAPTPVPSPAKSSPRGISSDSAVTSVKTSDPRGSPQGRRENVQTRKTPVVSTQMLPVMALMQLGEADAGAAVAVEHVESADVSGGAAYSDGVAAQEDEVLEENNELLTTETEAAVAEIATPEPPSTRTSKVVEKRQVKVEKPSDSGSPPASAVAQRTGADPKETSDGAGDRSRKRRHMEDAETVESPDHKRTSHRPKKPNRRFDI